MGVVTYYSVVRYITEGSKILRWSIMGPTTLPPDLTVLDKLRTRLYPTESVLIVPTLVTAVTSHHDLNPIILNAETLKHHTDMSKLSNTY